jgi:hypothetical protein
LWKLLERREVEAGLGQEALQEAGLVLHPPEPGLDQLGQLVDRAYFAGTASPDAYDPACSAYAFRSLPT